MAPADPGALDVRGTELVLLAGGAVITLVVFVIGVLLFRAAAREHRQQLERERRELREREEREQKGAG